MAPATAFSPEKASGRPLRLCVGAFAVAAPILHSATDVMEWLQHGFSPAQLWLNYLAFVPMSWLLLGIYCAHERKPGWVGLAGALLYGAAFTYFAYTTLLALGEGIATYEALWSKLGVTYTIHGALMLVGGGPFAWSVARAGWLPPAAAWLFGAGLLVNLVLALLPAPDILQIVGNGVRNLGLAWMGGAILAGQLRTNDGREEQ
jgi:hypothetical protein